MRTHGATATAGRQGQSRHGGRGLALTSIIGLLRFPGMEPIKPVHRLSPTNSARLRDSERSISRQSQDRREAPTGNGRRFGPSR